MHPKFTKRLRASMVARARFIITTKELEQAYFKNRTDRLSSASGE